VQRVAASLTVLVCCCLFGAVASARAATPTSGAAQTAAATPSAALGVGLDKPTMTAPRGYAAQLKPTFAWSRVSGARTYELRVYLQLRRGPELLLKKTGLTSLTWRSGVALPVNVGLMAQVRAVGPRGSGPWSGSLGFAVGADGTTNYSSRAHWLALPAKPLKKVDVFYLYPTEYTRPDSSAPIVCAVDDVGMMHGAHVAFQRQVTAFNTVANIYAPYYRQADSAARAALPQAQQVKIVAGGPTQDGIAAFDYFIRHYDQGRPFILVGHSLGSNVLANLLAKYMRARPGVYRRMVAAYVLGYSITPSYLAQDPFLKFATGPSDTGVIVSWNTEAPTVAGPNPVLLPGGLAINPITWTRKPTEATAKQNLGSIELNPATGTPVLDTNGSIKRVMGLADARVDKTRGVVICSTVDASAPPYYTPGGFPMGVLHPFDYPFYFFDVRANAANRVAHFFARQ
jgi:hypothetical protein